MAAWSAFAWQFNGEGRALAAVAVDVDAADAVRQNVLVGGTAPGGGRYATVGGADAVFVISRRTAADFTAPLAE